MRVGIMLDWLPENIASFGNDVDSILGLIYYIVFFWLILVELILVYFLIVYRKKEGKRSSYVPGNTWKAMSFVLVPAAIVLMLDLYIDARSAGVWAKIKETMPPAERSVKVLSEQFAWTFTYPGKDKKFGTGTDFDNDELVVPVDEVIHLELTSKDVLHSLWIPNLRFKQDIVPGRTIKAWFKAIKKGSYPIACAELCGVNHTTMGATLKVVSKQEYEEWLNEKASEVN